MNRKLLKHLEQQFGANWSCACRTPFDPGRFEILSENSDAFLAHYICAVCGREQMLAASMGPVSQPTGAPSRGIEALSTNDVLDIRLEIKRAPLKKIRSWNRGGRKEKTQTATDVDTIMRFSKD